MNGRFHDKFCSCGIQSMGFIATTRKVYKWCEETMVAEDAEDARTLLLDKYTAAELRQGQITEATEPVRITEDSGETFIACSPSEVAERWGRGIIPVL